MRAIPLRRGLCTAAVLAATMALEPGGAVAQVTERPVDIRAEHDRIEGSAGPLVLSDNDVHPGPGPELTLGSASVDNPSGWAGNVLVDIDPEASTITVEVESAGCYDSVLVEIGATWIQSVATVSDALFDPSGSPVTLTAVVIDPGDLGRVSLSWTADDGDCPLLNVVGSQAVFSYEASHYAPMSIEPSEVRAGDPVTVSGSQCPNSPVELEVTLLLSESVPHQGSDVPVIEVTVQADGEGRWSYEIDTSGLEPGIYSVRSRCLLVAGEAFEYEGPASFVVSGAVVPPAEPVPGPPTFTG